MRNGAWKTVVRAPDDENRQSTNGTATQRMRWLYVQKELHI